MCALLELILCINGVILISSILIFLNEGKFYLSFVNPLVIYYNIKVNWFGAIVLTLIVNILLPVASIPYWIYKLFTVGRKD